MRRAERQPILVQSRELEASGRDQSSHDDSTPANRLAQVVADCRRVVRLHRAYWLVLLVLTAILTVWLGLALASAVPLWLAPPIPVALVCLMVPLTLGATLWLLGSGFAPDKRHSG
jgi:hypothetical protein